MAATHAQEENKTLQKSSEWQVAGVGVLMMFSPQHISKKEQNKAKQTHNNNICYFPLHFSRNFALVFLAFLTVVGWLVQ